MFAWLTAKASHPVIDHFELVPPPPPETPIDQCPLLAIDLELTGLSSRKDRIVSIGWVPIHGLNVVLSGARHYLIETPVSVGQSAVFHGVHDRDLRNARPLAEVMTELLHDYAGYVFVAHNAQLDSAFLRRAMKRLFGQTARLVFLDTLNIEHQSLQRRGGVFREDGLRLDACLHRHKLPVGASHKALEDAYSCALLLLTQVRRGDAPMPRLGELLKDSR